MYYYIYWLESRLANMSTAVASDRMLVRRAVGGGKKAVEALVKKQNGTANKWQTRCDLFVNVPLITKTARRVLAWLIAAASAVGGVDRRTPAIGDHRPKRLS